MISHAIFRRSIIMLPCVISSHQLRRSIHNALLSDVPQILCQMISYRQLLWGALQILPNCIANYTFVKRPRSVYSFGMIREPSKHPDIRHATFPTQSTCMIKWWFLYSMRNPYPFWFKPAICQIQTLCVLTTSAFVICMSCFRNHFVLADDVPDLLVELRYAAKRRELDIDVHHNVEGVQTCSIARKRCPI